MGLSVKSNKFPFALNQDINFNKVKLSSHSVIMVISEGIKDSRCGSLSHFKQRVIALSILRLFEITASTGVVLLIMCVMTVDLPMLLGINICQKA